MNFRRNKHTGRRNKNTAATVDLFLGMEINQAQLYHINLSTFIDIVNINPTQ